MNIEFEKIPQEKKDRPQWVVWKWEERDGKPTKPPYDPKTGKRASHNDPSTWGTFEDAIKALDRGFDGIGFVFTEKDPFCGIDLDKCRNPTSGQIATWALKIIEDFDSYTEPSPSKTGLKIFIKGRLPGGGIKTKHVEIYDRLRYFTVTGERYGDQGNIKENQEALDRLIKKLRPPEEPKAKPTPQGERTYDDNPLVDKMLESQSGDKILRLFKGDWGDYPSQSEADQALCNHLAFWTRNNEGQIDRIFRTSGLMRDKWDKKHFGDGRTYGQATIEKAIASTSETYSGASERHINSDKQRKGPRGLGLDQLQNQYDSEVSWIWRRHVPAGLPIILNGREGTGKTTISLRIGKEILEQHSSGMVVWLATEGTVQDTVAKMVEQGLTSSRFVVAQKSNESFKWDFVLQGDRKELEMLLDDLRPILCVFIDSIRGMSRLDDNDPKNGVIMHMINSLICDKHRGGLVYIDHMGKGAKSNLLDKAVGTTAKTSSVRGVLSVMPVSKFKRIIKPAKANISSMGGDLEVIKVGNKIIIQDPKIHSDETMKHKAEEWLINLFSRKGNMRATEVYRMGEEEGFSGSLLKIVKKDLGIDAVKNTSGYWEWTWLLDLGI